MNQIQSSETNVQLVHIQGDHIINIVTKHIIYIMYNLQR